MTNDTTFIYHWGVYQLFSLMNEADRKKMSIMLKRIQGQVGGIERMVSGGKDCEAVITQVTAAMSSLKSVAKSFLADAAGSCSKAEYEKLLKRFL